MKLVVDTSVIIAVIANEPEKPALIELAGGMEVIAPSVHRENGNAFSAMLKRKRVSPEEAFGHWRCKFKPLAVYER